MDNIKVASISSFNWIGEPEKAIKNMEYWVAKAAEQNAELILFPELSVSGYFAHDTAWDIAETIPGPSTDKIVKLAKEYGCTICFGILEKAADIIYNTQVLVNCNGIIGTQRKLHIPEHENPFWRAGFEINVFDIGKVKVGISICRDSFYPDMIKTLYFKGADVILMPFGYSTIPRSRYLNEHIHGIVIRSMCWIYGCFAVGCNSAGKREKSELEPRGFKFPGWAGIIDPHGNPIKYTSDDGNDEAMIIADLDPELLSSRRRNPNFLQRGLMPNLYKDII